MHMRNSLFSFFLIPAAAIVLTALPVAAPAARAFTPPNSFADLAEKLEPAVVNISSTQKVAPGDDEQDGGPEMPHFPPGSPFEDFFQQYMQRYGQQQQHAPAVPMASLGSGFVIDAAKGYIVTNGHVVKDAEDVRVTFHDDSTVDAEVVGKDDKMDLAVLKVKVDKDKKLTAIPFGDSDKMRIGDWVLAIGNPFGLGGTVTAGIVSAQQRDIQAGPYDDFIQTDASINRGNSGGPMFNMNGEVIGINTAIFSPGDSGGSVGIGFAIPSNLAKPVIEQLIAYGHTQRGWLGVRIQAVTDEIAESLGKGTPKGALVASVTPTGPAEKAGLQAGDIITGFDGKSIAEMRTLPRTVAQTPIGARVKLTYWRNGKSNVTTVEVGELEKAEKEGLITEASPDEQQPEPAATGSEVKSVGLTVREIKASDREQYRIPNDITGVIVSAVDPAKEAAIKGLAPGDVIVEINQQPVKAPADVVSFVNEAEKSGRGSVLLLVNREGEVRFVALRFKKDSGEKTPEQKAPDAKKP
jgi:serine protease Do